MLHRAKSWLRNTFRRSHAEHEMDAELRFHLDAYTEDLVRGGVPREEAERRARIEFGGIEQTKEQCREATGTNLIESYMQDLRFGLRLLRKSSGFTAIVILTLALGIGANTAVFSVLNRVLLQPLPYPGSNQLIALRLDAPGAGGLAGFANGLQLSPSMYITFSDQNKTLQSMGIWTAGRANVTGVARPEEVGTATISDGILQTLDVAPLLGRWFAQDDYDPRGGKTMALSYGYWRRRFGGDPRVIGRTVQVDAQPREIVGVMPRGFRIMDQNFDVLIPMPLDRVHQKLAPFGYDGIARLKPGVSLEQADADVARLIPVWMDSWSNGPGTNPHYYDIWGIAPKFRSLKQQVIGNVSSVLWVVMATVGLVLLIACANTANLLLVRAESRQHELSIRVALGASRGRIARELLLQSAVLGMAAGGLAVGVAYIVLRALVVAGPADLPRLSEISLDANALGFTLLISIFSGLFSGSIIAWRYARAETSMMMGAASRNATTSRGRQRSRDLLVIAQFAMALVLLVTAVLMIRTFTALGEVKPGFSDPAQVQTIRISIPGSLISDPLVVTRTQNNIADQIAAIPGVSAVGFASALPMGGFDPNWDQLAVEGNSYEGGEPPLRMYNYVSPGYFRAVGTRMLAGRDFTWTDIYGLRPMVIVSENFARESWGSAAAAVGKRVRQFSNLPWQEVIGVVEDVHVHGVDEDAPSIIFWPAMLNDPYTAKPTIDGPNSVTFAIRSERAGKQEFVALLQQAVWSVNPDLPVAGVRTMQDVYRRSLARTSFTLVMLAVAGSMALILSIIGIYGVISYAVSQRIREMGIRLALGARNGVLQWMFVRAALVLAGIGVAAGLIAASALVQLMKALLFGVSPLDPWTFVTVPPVLAAAAVLASYIPARRATRLDPMVALRYE